MSELLGSGEAKSVNLAAEQPPLLEGYWPELDDTVVLPGSLAFTGYRIPATGECGEVFLRIGWYNVVKVYPFDGRDQPVELVGNGFDFSDRQIEAAVCLAYWLRARGA